MTDLFIKLQILGFTYTPSYNTTPNDSDSMKNYIKNPEIWASAQSSIESIILQVLIGIAIFILLQVFTDGMFTIAIQGDDVELKTTIQRMIAAVIASTIGAIVLFKMIIFSGSIVLSMLNGGFL